MVLLTHGLCALLLLLQVETLQKRLDKLRALAVDGGSTGSKLVRLERIENAKKQCPQVRCSDVLLCVALRIRPMLKRSALKRLCRLGCLSVEVSGRLEVWARAARQAATDALLACVRALVSIRWSWSWRTLGRLQRPRRPRRTRRHRKREWARAPHACSSRR